MDSALAVPVLAAGLLLACAAPAKLRRPDLAARALGAAGAPGSPAVRRGAVRALGVGELVLAAAVLAAPRPAVLVVLAGAYAGFAVFVAVLLRRGAALSSCGCFGRPDTPATAAHVVVVSAVAVVVAAAALTGSADSVTTLLDAGVLHAVAVVSLAVLTTALLWACLAVVPLVRAAAAVERTGLVGARA